MAAYGLTTASSSSSSTNVRPPNRKKQRSVHDALEQLTLDTTVLISADTEHATTVVSPSPRVTHSQAATEELTPPPIHMELDDDNSSMDSAPPIWTLNTQLLATQTAAKMNDGHRWLVPSFSSRISGGGGARTRNTQQKDAVFRTWRGLPSAPCAVITSNAINYSTRPNLVSQTDGSKSGHHVRECNHLQRSWHGSFLISKCERPDPLG